MPFDTASGAFRDFVNVKDTVISRNFFKDLEKPVLADDVYSQYELEYLIDNVRPSEWVGRENHVYLHYSDWAKFCSWLQVLTLRPLLEDKKLVFLIGDEISQYPIDFKRDSKMMQEFKYIKTFTPLRRPTTSYAATVRFMWNWHKTHVKTDEAGVMIDELSMRVANRSFMRDPEDRLYHDSVIVRFEDGKLNPKATFAALAAFLDVPYTESMTYGSISGNPDPHNMGDRYDKGFMAGPVYATYDEYADESERRFIEYFLRDVYAYYGYDFQWYDGTEMTEEKLEEMLAGCKTLYGFIRQSWRDILNEKLGEHMDPESREKEMTELENARVQQIRESRAATAHILQSSQRYINRRGQPLQMTPMLEPAPELMERERYH